MDFELDNYDYNSLKNCLKKYQVNILDEILKKNDMESAIEVYLSANGPSTTIPFGGQPSQENSKPFINRFKDEFDKFVCGHPDYAHLYPKVSKTAGNYSTMIVASISSALGATLGLSAALISPAVVLSLTLFGTMGRKAYCSNKQHLLPPVVEK
ncbi:MAG: hypothetical protein ACOX2I_14215 [Candidatus Ozemobacteraceae bacterium]